MMIPSREQELEARYHRQQVAEQRKLFKVDFQAMHFQIQRLKRDNKQIWAMLVSMSQSLGQHRNAINFIVRGRNGR